jgi:hypothetical protein
MKEFIHYIVEQIVSQPEEIKITQTDEDGFEKYLIEVADDDMGLIIGKHGRTIKSIRSLVKAKAIKDGVRIRVELQETDEV